MRREPHDHLPRNSQVQVEAMRYNIISINDDRKDYSDAIRRQIDLPELVLPAVNGREVDLDAEFEKRQLERLPVWNNAKVGELGVWLSNFDRWETVSCMDEGLVVFEDDAILDPYFNTKFRDFWHELPHGWDFAALWVPENQRQDYLYDATFDHHGSLRINGFKTPETSIYRVPEMHYGALVYQGYGMVSLVYSPKGGARLVELARKYGIDEPVDCWIYQQAHLGRLEGYAPKPEHATIVHYDWKAPSHVQLTERAQ